MGEKARRRVNRRKWATVFLRTYMGELRKLLAERQPEMDARFPDRAKACATCAFNPATDSMQGWDTTTMRVLQAATDLEPFYCHHKMAYARGTGWIPPADRAQLRLCAGYADLIGHVDLGGALARALKVAGAPPDADAAKLYGAFDGAAVARG